MRWWKTSRKRARAVSPNVRERPRAYSVRWSGSGPLGPSSPRTCTDRRGGRPGGRSKAAIVDGANASDGSWPRRIVSSEGRRDRPSNGLIGVLRLETSQRLEEIERPGLALQGVLQV